MYGRNTSRLTRNWYRAAIFALAAIFGFAVKTAQAVDFVPIYNYHFPQANYDIAWGKSTGLKQIGFMIKSGTSQLGVITPCGFQFPMAGITQSYNTAIRVQVWTTTSTTFTTSTAQNVLDIASVNTFQLIPQQDNNDSDYTRTYATFEFPECMTFDLTQRNYVITLEYQSSASDYVFNSGAIDVGAGDGLVSGLFYYAGTAPPGYIVGWNTDETVPFGFKLIGVPTSSICDEFISDTSSFLGAIQTGACRVAYYLAYTLPNQFQDAVSSTVYGMKYAAPAGYITRLQDSWQSEVVDTYTSTTSFNYTMTIPGSRFASTSTATLLSSSQWDNNVSQENRDQIRQFSTYIFVLLFLYYTYGRASEFVDGLKG